MVIRIIAVQIIRTKNVDTCINIHLFAWYVEDEVFPTNACEYFEK